MCHKCVSSQFIKVNLQLNELVSVCFIQEDLWDNFVSVKRVQTEKSNTRALGQQRFAVHTQKRRCLNECSNSVTFMQPGKYTF